MNWRFTDRAHAGCRLAEMLQAHAGRGDAVVLGLARGGVVVAYQVATRLQLPLDVFVVRKLGVPTQPELAMGAIATGGITVLNNLVLEQIGIPMDLVRRVEAEAREELESRERLYRGHREPLPVEGKCVLLVDDGLATGASMRAAIQAVRRRGAKSIIVAVPVAPTGTYEEFQREADELVCALVAEHFFGVGAWYDDFSQTDDNEVRNLLNRAENHPRVLPEKDKD